MHSWMGTYLTRANPDHLNRVVKNSVYIGAQAGGGNYKLFLEGLPVIVSLEKLPSENHKNLGCFV